MVEEESQEPFQMTIFLLLLNGASQSCCHPYPACLFPRDGTIAGCSPPAMSSTKDSDLYGDIYSDEFIDFQDEVDVPADDQAATANDATTTTASSSSLPTPPESAENLAAAANASSQSYSAQIAQQFSAYKQDPAQERQPKAIPSTSSAIATFAGASTSGAPDAHGTVFGKKPSEMHDSG